MIRFIVDHLGYKAGQERKFDPGTEAAFLAARYAVDVPELGSGAVTVLTADRLITAADEGRVFACTAPLTVTISAGLSPRPSFIVDCPPTGNITIAVSGGALINGATSSLTRARSANVAGVAVLAHQDGDSYGVSGS